MTLVSGEKGGLGQLLLHVGTIWGRYSADFTPGIRQP
jgi:hypothetical protein